MKNIAKELRNNVLGGAADTAVRLSNDGASLVTAAGNPLPIGAKVQVVGAQTVGSIVTVGYSDGGTGTVQLRRTPIAGGSAVAFGSVVAAGSNYQIQAADRGYKVSGAAVTYLPPPAEGLAIPTVAPQAPTITGATAGNGSVTATFTRNADNGGDTIASDRLYAYRVSDNNLVGFANGTSPITLTGVANGVALMLKAASLGSTNGLGPLSTAYGPVTPVSNGIPVAPASTIGPYALGGAALSGGRTYTLTSGDDFTDPLSYVTPANPAGTYSTTRSYMTLSPGNGPRANVSGGLSLLGYDSDAAHTGYEDANRGAAITSFNDMITVTGGRMKLKSRALTPAEKALLMPANTPPNASAMIHTATSHLMMAPFFVEAKMKFNKSQVNMRGWHPSFWLMQAKSVGSYTTTELDWEGTSQKIAPNKFAWTAGSNNSIGGTELTYQSGVEYTFRIEVLADGSVFYYSNIPSGGGNGAMSQAQSLAANNVLDTTRPHYVLFTNHIANFASDPYTDADWVAAGNAGAVMDIDYFAVATQSGTLYQPQIAHRSYNANFGDALNISLPTATQVWGSAVTEDIESWAQESNEPGGDYAGGYLNKVPGLTYDLTGLTITGTPIPHTNKTVGTNRPGRIMVCRYTRVAGSACTPHRTIINIGPRLSVTSLPPAVPGVPYSYDLYAQADCGVLVSDASGNRAKTVVVTGLPAGMTYNDATGFITGTPSGPFAAMLSVTVTNSVGQSVTSTAAFTAFAADVGQVAPTITGTPALRNSWDFDKLSTLTIDSTTGTPHITAVAPADTGSLTLANASLTTSPTRVLRPNNRSAALFTKSANQFLIGSAAQAAGGSMVIVYEPASIVGAMQVAERSKLASGTTANREGLILNGYTAARRASSGSTLADATTTAGQATTAALHVAVVTFDTAGSNVALYYDGTATPNTTTTPVPSGMDTVTLGSRSASGVQSLPFDGYVYRVLDYSVVLTASQAEEAAAWARQYYGTANLA